MSMKSYGQFCPVAQALELLAERWTLLIVRELLCGSTRFNDILRGVPLMSRTLLSQRLKTLENAGVVVRDARAGNPEYHLTPAGEDLMPVVQSLGVWGKRWAGGELPEEQLDPSLLMWDMHRRIDVEAVKASKVVVRFDFADQRKAQQRYWLHIKRGEVDVCYTNPGYEVDLVVSTDVRTLTEVWMGRYSFREAQRDDRIRLDGPSTLQRQFPKWLQLSTFAAA